MKRMVLFLLAVTVFMAIGDVFAADQAVPNINDLQGQWTGKIKLEDSTNMADDASMTIEGSKASIGFRQSIEGIVSIKDKVIITGTDNQAGSWEFELKYAVKDGKVSLEGSAYTRRVGGKKGSVGSSGTAFFEKIIANKQGLTLEETSGYVYPEVSFYTSPERFDTRTICLDIPVCMVIDGNDCLEKSHVMYQKECLY